MGGHAGADGGGRAVAGARRARDRRREQRGDARCTRSWMAGFNAPGTPAEARQGRVSSRSGRRRRTNVLVLEPGTSAGAGLLRARSRSGSSKKRPGWQVWSVERRENLLENQSELERSSSTAKSPPKQFFDYYLGYLGEPNTEPHYKPITEEARGRRRRARMGHERGGRRPPRGDRSRQSARRQGRARRPLARRLGRDRLRHLGLRRQTGRRRPLGPRLRSTAAASPIRDQRSRSESRAHETVDQDAVARVRRDPRAAPRAVREGRRRAGAGRAE